MDHIWIKHYPPGVPADIDPRQLRVGGRTVRGELLTEQALMKFCAEQLTGYKKPKYIIFQQELPKTNVGKVLRRELRDAALKAAKKAA